MRYIHILRAQCTTIRAYRSQQALDDEYALTHLTGLVWALMESSWGWRSAFTSHISTFCWHCIHQQQCIVYQYWKWTEREGRREGESSYSQQRPVVTVLQGVDTMPLPWSHTCSAWLAFSVLSVHWTLLSPGQSLNSPLPSISDCKYYQVRTW